MPSNRRWVLRHPGGEEPCEGGREGDRETERGRTWRHSRREEETERQAEAEARGERDAKGQEDRKKNPSGWSRKIRKLIRGAESDLNLKGGEKWSKEQRDRRIGSEEQRERIREREADSREGERGGERQRVGQRETSRSRAMQASEGTAQVTRGDRNRGRASERQRTGGQRRNGERD